MKKIIFLLIFLIFNFIMLALDYNGSMELEHISEEGNLSTFDQNYNIRLRDEKWYLNLDQDRVKGVLAQKNKDIRYKEYIQSNLESNTKEGGITLYYKNFFNISYIESDGTRVIDTKYNQKSFNTRLKYEKKKRIYEKYQVYVNTVFSSKIKLYNSGYYITDGNYNVNMKLNFLDFSITTAKTDESTILEEKYKYDDYEKRLYFKIKNYDDFIKKENRQEVYILKGYKKWEILYNYIENQIVNREISYEVNMKNKLSIGYNGIYYDFRYSFFDIQKSFNYSLKKSKEGVDNYIDFYYKKELVDDIYYKISGDTDFKKVYKVTNAIEYLF